MNWKLLIADLKAAGWTQPQIAAACGCGQATISELANGTTKDPRDSLGQALRALAAKVAENPSCTAVSIMEESRVA